MDRISRTAPLNEVIMSILESGLRTTAVVTEDSILIGVVTEGDIVRAIARGSGPGLTAEDLVNLAPGLLIEPVSDEQLVQQFLDNGHLAVPVVDSSGRLLRLESTASAIRRHLAYQ
jgi:CBS domain-containing protein